MIKLSNDLKVGDRINGKPIQKLSERTAFGIVMVDWGFGHAECGEYVSVDQEPQK